MRDDDQMTEFTFKDLLVPLSMDQFFRDHYERQPVHIPGNAEKSNRVFSWAELNGLMDMTTLWSEQSVNLVLDGKPLDPRTFCKPGALREGGPALRPVPQRLGELLAQGATLVLNLMERLTPGVAAVAEAIEMVTGGQTVCNVYCSWDRQQAFSSHFDNTDVFVLQIEGHKRWRIYEGRFENPMDNSAYTFDAFSSEHHEQAKGKHLVEVEMGPGDVLYIPCGQYHDACASGDASLHLSFGVNRTTGIDVVEILLRSLPDVSEFRAPLPCFDDVEAQERHMRALAERLAALLSAPATAAQVREFQRECAFRDSAPRLALPSRGGLARYRVRPLFARLENAGASPQLITSKGRETLAAHEARIVAWTLDRDHFTNAQASTVFSDLDNDLVVRSLDKLQAMKVIEPL